MKETRDSTGVCGGGDSTPLRVLVCGGRDFSDWDWLNEELTFHAFTASVIIHGAARGADLLADDWARASGIKRKKFPADWKKHGRAAGPIRNQQMIDEGKPNLVIAFPGGKGTDDMIARAYKAGIRVIELGLSSAPSSTPVDTVRKQKSVLFDEKTKEAIESLRENVKSWSKPIAGADYNQIAKHILTVCNFAEEKEE